jgi:hypothetical protein
MNRSAADRRREKRRAAEGEVRLFIDEPLPFETSGRLVDVSKGGFRAAHHYAELGAGREVRFRHQSAEGKARVVWTRILAQDIESGFMVLET